MPNMRLAKARKALGMSQQALADAVGASKSHLSQIEEGRKRPSVELADHIASLLGQRVEALFGREALALAEGRVSDTETRRPGA